MKMHEEGNKQTTRARGSLKQSEAQGICGEEIKRKKEIRLFSVGGLELHRK